MKKQNFIAGINLIIMMFFAMNAFAMSSPSYTLNKDVLSGGGGSSSSTTYNNISTTAQSSAIGASSSGSYNNYAGFWYAVAQNDMPDISASPTSLNFGDVNVNTTSTQQIVTFTNAGTADLYVSGGELLGADAAMFAVTGVGANPCNPPFTAHAGESCTLGFTFTPTSTGAKTATFRVYSDDPDSPNFDVPLSGTGVGQPNISSSVSSLNFGSLTVNTTTTAQTVTFTNTGTADLNVTGGALTGTDSSMFAIIGGTCPTPPFTSTPSESCNLSFTFTPTSTGAKSGVFTVYSDDPDTPTLNIPLSGTGVQQPAQAPEEPMSVVLSCPTNVTAGNALTVTVKLYNYDCTNSISVNRLMMQLMGNSSGTLMGLGIWGPYNKSISTKTVPAATCDEFGNVTPGGPVSFSLTIMSQTPASLAGKMAEVTVDAITSKGESFGSGSCMVNVTGTQ